MCVYAHNQVAKKTCSSIQPAHCATNVGNARTRRGGDDVDELCLYMCIYPRHIWVGNCILVH